MRASITAPALGVVSNQHYQQIFNSESKTHVPPRPKKIMMTTFVLLRRSTAIAVCTLPCRRFPSNVVPVGELMKLLAIV